MEIGVKTKLIRMDEQHIDVALIKEAGDVIRAGGLVAFPTETVYGLGGDALNRDLLSNPLSVRAILSF